MDFQNIYSCVENLRIILDRFYLLITINVMGCISTYIVRFCKTFHARNEIKVEILICRRSRCTRWINNKYEMEDKYKLTYSRKDSVQIKSPYAESKLWIFYFCKLVAVSRISKQEVIYDSNNASLKTVFGNFSLSLFIAVYVYWNLWL